MKMPNRRNLGAFLLVLLLMTLIAPGMAYAEGVGSTDDLGSLERGFDNLLNMLRTIATGGAVISVAINGLLYLTGNEKTAETAKKGIIYTLMAIAGIYMITAMLSVGKSWFTPWNPYSPGA